MQIRGYIICSTEYLIKLIFAVKTVAIVMSDETSNKTKEVPANQAHQECLSSFFLEI